MSQLFASGGQSIGVSASAPDLPIEYSGLISFRIDWFDLLAVHGTLKSLLQHHSLKVSFLQHSAFFMVQLSHLYRTTGKTIAVTRLILSFSLSQESHVLCQSTLCNALDCSPPSSSVHSILQARILEWVVISSSRGSSRPRN